MASASDYQVSAIPQLTGSLSKFDPATLVRFLCALRKSGDLLVSRGHWIGQLAVDDGRLIAAAIGDNELGAPALECWQHADAFNAKTRNEQAHAHDAQTGDDDGSSKLQGYRSQPPAWQQCVPCRPRVAALRRDCGTVQPLRRDSASVRPVAGYWG